MRNKAKGILLREEMLDALLALSDEQRGKLILALFSDSGICEAPELDATTRMAFICILPSVRHAQEEATRRYNASIENGKKGGRPKKQPDLEETEKPTGLEENPLVYENTDGISEKTQKTKIKLKLNQTKLNQVKEDINTLSECLSSRSADDSPAGGILPRDLPTEQEQLSLTENTDSAIATASELEKTPSCPYQEIIDLYHRQLPEHPKVALLNESRRRTIKARWADVGKRLKAQGKPYGRDERLHYFTLLFGRASKSDFLCGRITGSNGRPYIVNFDKLMSPSGFIGIIEGKYDNR